MPTPYLLDTTVLLHWTRDSPQAKAIDQQFHLSTSLLRPLICEISLGEMRAFSRSLNWGALKLQRLTGIERDVVVVRIGDARILDAYADLSTLAKSQGWALFHGKNDLVGGRRRVRDAESSLDDGWRLPSVARPRRWQVTVLDPETGQPRP